MTNVLYDESKFPEYREKLQRRRKSLVQTAIAGVAGYFSFVLLFAFVLFPDDPVQAKVLGALILLVIPILTVIYPPIGYWVNARNPRRVTDEAIVAVGRWPLVDIQELIWYGPGKGVEIRLDPEKHRIRRGRIPGQDLIRPEEFLRALEGRVPILRKEAPAE